MEIDPRHRVHPVPLQSGHLAYEVALCRWPVHSFERLIHRLDDNLQLSLGATLTMQCTCDVPYPLRMHLQLRLILSAYHEQLLAERTWNWDEVGWR